VWCPINPRNEAAENRFVLDAFDCSCLIFHSNYAPLVEQMRADLPKVKTLVCLDQRDAVCAGAGPNGLPARTTRPSTCP
jgi:fatty-acyl-CoA synthase